MGSIPMWRSRGAVSALFVVGASLFVLTYLDVRVRGPLSGINAPLSQLFLDLSHKFPTLFSSISGLSAFLGSSVGFFLLVASASFLCLAFGDVPRALAAAIFGALVGFLTLALQRNLTPANIPIPDDFPHAIRYSFTFLFPSGHTIGGTLGSALLLFLPYESWATGRGRKPSRERALLSTWIVVSLLVGVGRVVRGVHYSTDVLAGWGVALFLVALLWEITPEPSPPTPRPFGSGGSSG